MPNITQQKYDSLPAPVREALADLIKRTGECSVIFGTQAKLTLAEYNKREDN